MANLAAEVKLEHSAPHRNGGDILVDLSLSVVVGPKFTISSISADGGPLFQGKDLSPLYVRHPGDAAGHDPFQRIEPGLFEWYRRFGYLEVRTEHQSTPDLQTALVAYRLSVIPGPAYHLRQLTVRNLNPAQEAKARELLEMKAGDPFNANAADTLSQKCNKEPVFGGRNVVTETRVVQEAKAVDLVIESFD